MDHLRIGRSVRALRQRLGWRQSDLAKRASVSQSTISRLERGLFSQLPVITIEGVMRALGADLDLRVRWRGEELDRLLDATHAAIVERVVRKLEAAGWETAIEVTFAIYGERGSIDILAWHPAAGRLLVIEAKSIVADIQATFAALDRYVRLATAIGAARGWRPTGVARALILPDTSTNRRRITAASTAVRGVLPDGPDYLRKWLANPTGRCPAALWFLSDMPPGTAIRRRRVRTSRQASKLRERGSLSRPETR